MICSKCGTKNNEGDKICNKCKTPLQMVKYEFDMTTSDVLKSDNIEVDNTDSDGINNIDFKTDKKRIKKSILVAIIVCAVFAFATLKKLYGINPVVLEREYVLQESNNEYLSDFEKVSDRLISIINKEDIETFKKNLELRQGAVQNAYGQQKYCTDFSEAGYPNIIYNEEKDKYEGVYVEDTLAYVIENKNMQEDRISYDSALKLYLDDDLNEK